MRKVVFIHNCDDKFGQRLINTFLRMGWFVVATLSRLDERKHFIIRDNLCFADSILILEADPRKPERLDCITHTLEAHVDSLDCFINIVPPASFGHDYITIANFDNLYSYMTNSYACKLLSKLREIVDRSEGSILHVSFAGIWAYGFDREIDFAASVALRKVLMRQTLNLLDSGSRATFVQSSPSRWHVFSRETDPACENIAIFKPLEAFDRIRKYWLIRKIKRVAIQQIDKSYLTATSSLFLALLLSGYLLDDLNFRLQYLKMKLRSIRVHVNRVLK